jgi:hypothetical protein
MMNLTNEKSSAGEDVDHPCYDRCRHQGHHERKEPSNTGWSQCGQQQTDSKGNAGGSELSYLMKGQAVVSTYQVERASHELYHSQSDEQGPQQIATPTAPCPDH